MSGASPNIPLGSLNRLVASLSWADFPGLNVTAPFLGKRGITLAFMGNSTVRIDTMTGQVTSPEPYLGANVTIHLLKTQALADAYKLQMENNSLLGNMTVRSDAQSPSMLSPWNFTNGSIDGVDMLDFSGADAGYVVRIGGIYVVNSGLYT
jgi:hypothetical protein